MSALRSKLPGRRTMTAVLALAVLAGALAATAVFGKEGDPRSVHDRLGLRPHGQPGDELRVGDAGAPGGARQRQQEQRGRPDDQGLLRRRRGDADHGRRRLQPARQPDARERDRRLRVDAVAGRVQHLPDEQQPAVRPGADLDVRLDLPAATTSRSANVGNQQVNPLVDYLTHKLGTKKIYIVASDFSSGHIGAGQVTGAGDERQRAGRRHLVRAARHDRLLERHRQDRGRRPRHRDRHPRRQRRDRVLQAVQDRPALEGHPDRELPDGRRHRRGDRRSAAPRDGPLDRLLQGQPRQGQPAVHRRDDQEVRRQGRRSRVPRRRPGTGSSSSPTR